MDEPTGELITEVFDHDGGRPVTVYRPPVPPEAIVFAGDGQLIASWGARLAVAGAPPTMIVGAHRTTAGDEWARIAEYSPTVDPARFDAHATFLVDEVGGWVRRRFGVDLPAERTAVVGVSAGAELALGLVLRYPDRFGVLFAVSPGGGYQPPSLLPPVLPRCYLVGGTDEPFFWANTTRWADALRAAGAEVVLRQRPGGHGDPFWASEFITMIDWAFGR